VYSAVGQTDNWGNALCCCFIDLYGSLPTWDILWFL